MRIIQILSGAGPHDAITNEARSFRERFRGWGWGGEDFAVHLAPGLNGAVNPIEKLKIDREDLLLLHHSARVPTLSELLALPNRKLLLYHNITPPSWLWEHAPIQAMHCALGRRQLPQLVDAVELAAADSGFNAAELEQMGATRTEVIPLLVDYSRLGAAGAEERPAGPPTVLFVGRLSPHKRQDEVIKAFSLYRRSRAPDARLVLVGDSISTEYVELLRGLAESLAPGAVTIETSVTNAELGEHYRSAHAFLCMSAHEGFCIPLLEALHFGVPVLARPAGAIPETLGPAGVIVEDDDLAVVAELLHLVVSDSELRSELRRRGREQLAAFAPDRVADRLRHAIETTLASPSRAS